MKLFERNNVLYVEYKEKDGSRVRKSLKIEDTPKNREYALSTLIPKMRKEKKAPKKQTLLSFLEIALKDSEAKKPATYKVYEIACRCIIAHFGKNRDILDINIKNIDDFIKDLTDNGMSASTVNTYLALLGLAFKEAMRVEAIQKNPMEYCKKPKIKMVEKEIFTKAEIESLLQNASGYMKVFLMIAFYTGARAGEILALEWSEYDGKTLHIQKTLNINGQYNLPKNGKKRKIPIPKALIDFLDTIEDKSVYIIGKKLNKTANMNDKFKQYQQSLGFENIKSLHSIRHTTTSLLLSAKENPMLIQKMLGHSSLDMISKVYGHYIQDHSDFRGFEQSFTK